MSAPSVPPSAECAPWSFVWALEDIRVPMRRCRDGVWRPAELCDASIVVRQVAGGFRAAIATPELAAMSPLMPSPIEALDAVADRLRAVADEANAREDGAEAAVGGE